MPLDEIYHIIHAGTLQGEAVQNDYFYRVDTGVPSALNIAQAFIEDIQPLVVGWLCNNLVFNRVKVINLGDLTDFYDATVTGTGEVTANMLPPANAVNITMRTDTRAVRPGSKRYSGIGVTAATDGVITDATVIGLINELATALASPIGYDTEPEAMYKPIVVKRVFDAEIGEEGGYRLPKTDGELVFGNVTGALWNTKVSHQDTRSNGQ